MRLLERSNLVFLLLLVLALGILGLGLTDTPFSRALLALLPAPREGAPAPDFKLPTVENDTMTLSDLRGQVVIINWWTSWCPPCRAEMPAINNVYLANKEKGLEVLAVNSTFQDSEADAVAFAQAYELAFPILLDRDGSVGRRYQLRALPTTYFVDRKGVIRAVIPGGPMSGSLIESKVADLLAESP